MKKIALIITAVLSIGLTSCDKEETTVKTKLDTVGALGANPYAQFVNPTPYFTGTYVSVFANNVHEVYLQTESFDWVVIKVNYEKESPEVEFYVSDEAPKNGVEDRYDVVEKLNIDRSSASLILNNAGEKKAIVSLVRHSGQAFEQQ